MSSAAAPRQAGAAGGSGEAPAGRGAAPPAAGPPAQHPQLIAGLQHLLGSMGVEDSEPRVVAQLVDFVYRHVADVLQDAESYSVHAGKPPGHVDVDNVMLAIQARSGLTFAAPPNQEELAAMAAHVNASDLPRFPAHKPGLLIPDDKDCLTAQNYTLKLG